MDPIQSKIDEYTQSVANISYDGTIKLDDFMAAIKDNLSDITSIEGSEEEYALAEDAILRYIDEEPVKIVKRRRRVPVTVTFWDTFWGQTICDPNVNDPYKHEGKLFRHRFRLPFPIHIGIQNYFLFLQRFHNTFTNVMH